MCTLRRLSLAVALGLAACSRPEPPTITPVSGRVTSVRSTGVTVEARLEGYNPNGVDIGIRSFTAALTLDGRLQA